MFDKILNSAIAITFLTFIGLVFFLIPDDLERTDRAKEVAKEMNCEYLGAARDMGSVRFLDCNGEIKLIRAR